MPNGPQSAKERKKRKIGILALFAIAVLPACSAAAQQPNSPTLAPDYRLEIIGFRLATSNLSLCESPAMLTGAMLHDEGGFSQNVREHAKARYALGSGFGVVQVVPGSPAAAAGLQRGDEIMAINGASLTDFARSLVRRGASYDRTQRFVDTLDAQLRRAPAVLTVERQGAERVVTLGGTPGCGGPHVLVDSNKLNAWSDGTNVAVTSRMVGFAASDDELAFVVAHEMAHNILKHSEKFNLGRLILAEFGLGSGKVRKAELAADALAIEMMADAGYDLDAPEMLLRRAAQRNPLNLSLSHPGAGRRIAAAQATRGRIAVRRAFWESRPGAFGDRVLLPAVFGTTVSTLSSSNSDRLTVVARLDRQAFAAPSSLQPVLPPMDSVVPLWISQDGLLSAPLRQLTIGNPDSVPTFQFSWPTLTDRAIRK